MKISDRTIYLDYNATTPVIDDVFEEMAPYFTTHYGNPSSTYRLGKKASEALDLARQRVAKLINCDADEVFFTSGATESNNLALFGNVQQFVGERAHLITSMIEHPSVMQVAEHLDQSVDELEVAFLPVDRRGKLLIADLEKLIKPDTRLISLMAANNTVGTIQDIHEIGSIANKEGVIFHTDATQAVGKIDIDVKSDKIDLLSMSGHKIYGPKGVGALYINRKLGIHPRLFGGGQERDIRPGTENVPGIVGLGKACELAGQRIDSFDEHMSHLRDCFRARLDEEITGYQLISDPACTLASTVNISFEDIRGEAVVEMLGYYGVDVSTCSACSSNHEENDSLCPPLKAMGLSDQLVRGAVRFSFGIMTTEEEIATCFNILRTVVDKLRQMAA